MFCAIFVWLLADGLCVCFTVFARSLVVHFFVGCLSTDFVYTVWASKVLVNDVNTEVIFKTFDNVSQKV